MDSNKLQVLKNISYTIPKQCQLCKHADFARGEITMFGVCNVQTYQHEKHGERRLSVFRGGVCGNDKFEPNETYIDVWLDTWAQFLSK